MKNKKSGSRFLVKASFLACVPLLPASLPAQDETPSEGSLSGRVVAGQQERPVAGAYVTTSIWGRSVGEGVFADADGAFRFAGLIPGDYYIVAVKTGFAVVPSRIALGTDHAVDDLTLRMVRRGALFGTIRDADGKPVVGARVRSYVFGTDIRGPGWQPSRDATTDDRGLYRLWSLAEGRYLIVVEAHAEQIGPGRRRLVHGPVFYPEASGPEQAEVIELGVGQERGGIDVTLPAPTRSVLFGSVVQQSDGRPKPCEDCGLTVYQLLQDDFFRVAQALTAQDGSFVLDGLPGGEYLLAMEEFSPTTPGRVSGQQTVVVSRDGQTKIAATLRPGVPLTVRLRLIDPPDELPSEDAQRGPPVRLIPIGPPELQHSGFDLQPTPPDEAPGFTWEWIAPGRYFVAGVRYGGGRFAGLRADGREIVPPVIEVASSGRQSDYEMLIAFDGGGIRGEIDLDESRRGTILAVEAWLLDEDPSRGPARVHSSTGASFELSGLAPGRYQVFAGSARAMSRLSDPRVRSKGASRGVRVQVKANETVQIRLRALSVYDLSR